MSSELAVAARGLGKRYRIYARAEDRLKQLLWLGQRRFYREVEALRDVDLEVAPGEVVGVVGRNGSGKSTLLSLLAGTLSPSSGEIEIAGRVAALLELGAGFNPEFSGRENVRLSAAILGLASAEAEEKLPAILEFAAIGEAVDEPVRTYSSGMFARLAFAVAASVEPQVLIVDEILAVGDEVFQRKCYARIAALREGGTAVLFVSHNAGAVLELCDRAVLLDGGEKLLDGDPKSVVAHYQRLLYAPPEAAAHVRAEIAAEREEIEAGAGVPDEIAGGGEAASFEQADPAEPAVDPEEPAVDPAFLDMSLSASTTIIYDAHGAHLRNAQILTLAGEPVNCLAPGGRYRFCYEVFCDKDCYDLRFFMLVKAVSGSEFGGGLTPPYEAIGLERSAGTVIEVEFEFCASLGAGVYFLNCGVTGNGGVQLHRVVDALAFRMLPRSPATGIGAIDFDCTPRVRDQQTSARASAGFPAAAPAA